jgi:hypothetical protein
LDLYECCSCGEPYYKKADQCPYCDSKEFDKTDGTEEEVILTVLREINIESESGEYQQFGYDELEELIGKKLGKEFDYMSFDSALDNAIKKEYFSKMTLYISNS